MIYKRFTQIVSLMTVVLLLVACGAGEPPAVQMVKAFHEAINSIEPGEETGEGPTALADVFQEYTTRPGMPMELGSLAMAAGVVRFSNMEYELVSESPDVATVRAIGEISIGGEEAGPFEAKYVVVKQGEKWLIDHVLSDKE